MALISIHNLVSSLLTYLLDTYALDNTLMHMVILCLLNYSFYQNSDLPSDQNDNYKT